MANRVEQLRAELDERISWRAAARNRLAEAIENAVAAQRAYDVAIAITRDARGIIDEETEQIDKLLERLHELIPKQRPGG